MIVTTEKNPKPDTAAETEPADDAAGDDVENAIAEQADEAETDEAEDEAEGEALDEAEDGGELLTGKRRGASAASGPGGATCVAACCRCYSLPPLPFRASWAGGNGRSIR